MKILVTGGAGFIGSHLCDRLVARGDRVTILDDLSTGRVENLRAAGASGRLSLVRGSVLERELVDGLVADADLVFHLAAVVGVRLVLESPDRTVETNVEGTRSLLASARRHGVRCLLASSSEVYGKRTDVPFREDDPLLSGTTDEARWVYAGSKELGERLALAHAARGELQVVIVRLFNTVGPRQRSSFGMVLPSFVRQALAGEPITVFGDGRQRRTFVHVGDTVAACLALARDEQAYGRVYNVGGTEEISILALAELVKHVTSSASPIVRVPYDEAYGLPVEDPRRRLPDLSRLVAQTGLGSRHGVEAIVRELSRDPLLLGTA